MERETTGLREDICRLKKESMVIQSLTDRKTKALRDDVNSLKRENKALEWSLERLASKVQEGWEYPVAIQPDEYWQDKGYNDEAIEYLKEGFFEEVKVAVSQLEHGETPMTRVQAKMSTLSGDGRRRLGQRARRRRLMDRRHGHSSTLFTPVDATARRTEGRTSVSAKMFGPGKSARGPRGTSRHEGLGMRQRRGVGGFEDNGSDSPRRLMSFPGRRTSVLLLEEYKRTGGFRLRTRDRRLYRAQLYEREVFTSSRSGLFISANASRQPFSASAYFDF
ncbi:hypothetical protein THAOC_01074, partial [Thalassiosira oceanica]